MSWPTTAEKRACIVYIPWLPNAADEKRECIMGNTTKRNESSIGYKVVVMLSRFVLLAMGYRMHTIMPSKRKMIERGTNPMTKRVISNKSYETLG